MIDRIARAAKVKAGEAKDVAVPKLQAAWGWVKAQALRVWDAIVAFWNWMKSSIMGMFKPAAKAVQAEKGKVVSMSAAPTEKTA